MYIFLGLGGLVIFFTFLFLAIKSISMKKPKIIFLFIMFLGLTLSGVGFIMHIYINYTENETTDTKVNIEDQQSLTTAIDESIVPNFKDESQYITSLRDIYAEKNQYIEKEVILGPVKIMDNDVEYGLLRVNPSLGKEFLEYDRDVYIKIYYKHMGDEKKWRNTYADERPIIYVKGIVRMYSDSDSIYIHANEISEALNENWVIALNNTSDLENTKNTDETEDNHKETLQESKISYHGLGIPREFITRQFSDDEYGFVFEEQKNEDGIPTIIGKSAKIPTAIISIRGYKDNIRLVGLMYGINVKDNSTYGNERSKETVKVEFDLVQKLFPDKFPEVIAWSAGTLNQLDVKNENGWGPFINTYDEKTFSCTYGAANDSALKMLTIQHVKDDIETDGENYTNNLNADRAFISEEEAVERVLSLSEVAEATGGEASYMVEENPTKEKPYYVVRIYNDFETHIATVNFYTIDAYTGGIVSKEF